MRSLSFGLFLISRFPVLVPISVVRISPIPVVGLRPVLRSLYLVSQMLYTFFRYVVIYVYYTTFAGMYPLSTIFPGFFSDFMLASDPLFGESV